MMTVKRRIQDYLRESERVYKAMITSSWGEIERGALALVETYREKRGTVFTLGNGGSAADAQHIAGELVCMLRSTHTFKNRYPLPAQALTTDPSVVTAIANDLGYAQVFARQLEAMATVNDLVIGLSTSGKSKNVVLALELAKKRGVRSIAMTGKDGGEIVRRRLAQIVIRIPATDVGFIQQGHVAAFHSMCDVMEEILFGDGLRVDAGRGKP